MLLLDGGVPALKFRADNYSEVATLDQLEASNLIKRENDTYVVRSSALPFLDADPARRLLSSIERVYVVLRAHYRQAQQAQVPVTLLASQARLSVSDTTAALQMMLDTSGWCVGWTTDIRNEDAYVCPGEGILKNETYAQLVDEVCGWSAPHASLQPFDIIPTIDFANREPERDVERALPAPQADAVLSVTEDLEGTNFSLNDYYDDHEPQSVIDNVLTGKINTLRVYCETIGWRGLARRLQELTPLRGNAVEAMELVKSFIVPEVRRLTVIQVSTKPKEVNQMDDVLRAWPAVRACLQEFRFDDIKEIAGLAGFDVTVAAHLVQKSQGGATKGQLMSVIDEQVGTMDSHARHHFLTILVEEILRRRSEMQEKLSEYLSRLGWSFVYQTLVPLEVFDTSILADTPDESHKDLLKAAQRLRDGDLGGAISAACGAVDAATSKVYDERSLGDPTKASFQERCKRAALAKGVMIELDRQLDALGWPQADVSPFKKNLEGALNQGAYVMQTLRSHMGDVHGTKPILRSLVFDCLRWAELIVGALVERPDAPLKQR
ncbi:hypothetical protein [Burkholderia pseudomallei]|uniref:hypothetical protein n=1 Tax=Burkholderia pseudomallei TaxID=28450 RepID=UPI000B33F724|nr:hypothetical protein [Burkholderia pseudomallei]